MLTDNDKLQWGNKFKGEKLANVDAKYLLWMKERFEERKITPYENELLVY